MNNIDRLIATLYPNGVEYSPLEKLCISLKKSTLTQDKLNDSLQYPVINSGRDYYGRFSEYNNEGNAIVIASRGEYAGFVSYISEKFWAGGLCYPYRSRSETKAHTKYIFYVLKNSEQRIMDSLVARGSIPALNKADIDKFLIPLPPLPVQEEIVRILDTFSGVVTELEQKLEAEQAARVRQYEYYRDFLLTFDKPATQSLADRQTDRQIRWVTLGEIATVMRGASPRPISQYIANDPNGVNWIKIGDVEVGSKYVTKSAEKITLEGASKSRKVENGDFILSNSMSFGRPYILGIDGCVHDGWIILSGFENSCTSDFLYYLLNTRLVQNYWKQRAAAGGSIQNLNSDIVKGTIIPIPSLEVQEQIVSILDRFDTLVNDLKNGLPAEIALRRKQYETYRDKLLTFTRRA